MHTLTDRMSGDGAEGAAAVETARAAGLLRAELGRWLKQPGRDRDCGPALPRQTTRPDSRRPPVRSIGSAEVQAGKLSRTLN